MIRITCTHCRQVLTIDDGFAGGVCRCQHCGTIQTVPAAAGKAQGRGAAPQAKTLYRGATRSVDEHDDHHHHSGSGLDEIAEIVSSSGLSGHTRRLYQSVTGSGIPSPAAPEKKHSHSHTPMIVAGAIIVLAIIAAISFHKSPASGTAAPGPAPAPAPQPAAQTPPAPATAQPTFAGIPLQAQDTVVYLLDDGSSANDILPAMQAAVYQSIKSLGTERRFKVIFWREGSPTYPPDGTSLATADEEAKCEQALADAYGLGNTQVDLSLRIAMETQPDAIVIITAKAAQLSDDFADNVLSIRGDSKVRIYTIGVNGDSTTDPGKPGILADIAAKTDGQFLSISSADLKRLVH
ncbi:MAG: hypothetical protein ABSH22_18350 [Tepidisphaeraceae bacterium]|jgi:hypothetical protein